jgi:hypothetical protein
MVSALRAISLWQYLPIPSTLSISRRLNMLFVGKLKAN